MRKNITEEGHSLGALLRLPYEKLAIRTYAELAANGFDDIRPAHSSIFRHILPEGSRLTELAERAQLTKQSTSYLVDYLHQKGYLEFVPDPQDGRAKLVHLTERGVAFQKAAIALSRRLEGEVAKQIGTQNLAQLRDLLEQLNAHIDLIKNSAQRSGKLVGVSATSTSRQHSNAHINRRAKKQS
jgi:DNA-binding MarR family transcriptional regulator